MKLIRTVRRDFWYYALNSRYNCYIPWIRCEQCLQHITLSNCSPVMCPVLKYFHRHIKTAEQRTIIQQYSDWYNGRWWVGWYIWYSDKGTGWGPSPPRPLLAVPKLRGLGGLGPHLVGPLLAVPNVTAHPSTASVPTSYYSTWHYKKCLWSLKG